MASKNRYTRPSGIEATRDHAYFYWRCTLLGTPTFASAERFKNIIERFGTEEKLFKTFICRKAQKLLDAGFTVEQIKKEGEKLLGELPSKAEKPVKQKRVKKDVDVNTEEAPEAKKVDVVEIKAPKVEERVIYPWSNDPNYFKGEPHPLNVEEETKQCCMFPGRYLDYDCHGCPVHDKCQNSLKMGEETWKKGRVNVGPTVKKIKFNENGEAV